MHSTVRTFRAPDARAALAKVKAALGMDAVILATREIPGGLFRSAEIEVTAGLTAEEDVKSLTTPPPLPKKADAQVYAPVRSDDSSSASGAGIEMNAELAAMREALNALRAELREVRATAPQATSIWKMAPAASSVLAGLLQRGVDADLAEELLRHALTDNTRRDAGALFAAVQELVARKVTAADAPWQSEERKVMALVGPTGVGKTTTLAKIAARALMEADKKVALITVDTYRIGASDHLARYGEIMRVPTFVARDRAELNRVVQRTRDFDLVLIDTAGRSTSETVAKQAELIRAIPDVELALVLSLASGARELSAAAARYEVLNPDKLIFTKLDEAASPGGLLSAVARITQGIACITDGQRVPEDLHALSHDELVGLVTGNIPGGRGEDISARGA